MPVSCAIVSPLAATRSSRSVAATLVLLLALAGSSLRAQEAGPAPALADLDGEALYQAACANCHGVDGTGEAPSKLGFAVPLPDFSACSFATREPDADWIAVAHEGGPVRGFDRMMPAFGDALSVEQLQRIMDHIRTLCGSRDWPRGELNLPRALVTEKAYPEDEAVLSSAVALDGPGAVMNEVVYEKRVGVRSQVEVVVPFGFHRRSEGPDAAVGPEWASGVGDVVVGVKRDFLHSLESGSILSAAAELKLPTGDEADGFGSGTTTFESFLAWGQLLPAGSFLQVQGIVELPFDGEKAENEGALRAVLGRSFQEGRWGRTWSPMVEVLASRDLESGATTHWDLLPQVQVTLNTRQHVMANLGVRLPVNDTDSREPQLVVYLLWDWFDGGLFAGW
jgi:mono/diheme cytochrome c family protein